MKTILITGSSSGIGKGTAEYFADQNWQVAATMRNFKNDLKERENLKKFKLDVTNKLSIKKAVNAVIKEYGKIDVLVNNAGYGAFGPVEAATEEEIRRQFEVNVFGVLNVTREVLPYMRKEKSGVIINISSVGGIITMPLGSLYHGTKFCIEGISESMNYELNPLGIQVKLVEPGGVQTDFAGRSLNMFDNKIKGYDKLVKSMMKLTTKKSVMPSTPEDIAKVIYKASISDSKKIRYPAGKDAKMMLFVRKVFGVRAMMWFIKKMYGV